MGEKVSGGGGRKGRSGGGGGGSNPVGFTPGMREVDIDEKINAYTHAAMNAVTPGGFNPMSTVRTDAQSAAYKKAMGDVVKSLTSQGYTEKEIPRLSRWKRRFG